jgi:hypothetical protein
MRAAARSVSQLVYSRRLEMQRGSEKSKPSATRNGGGSASSVKMSCTAKDSGGESLATPCGPDFNVLSPFLAMALTRRFARASRGEKTAAPRRAGRQTREKPIHSVRIDADCVAGCFQFPHDWSDHWASEPKRLEALQPSF